METMGCLLRGAWSYERSLSLLHQVLICNLHLVFLHESFILASSALGIGCPWFLPSNLFLTLTNSIGKFIKFYSTRTVYIRCSIIYWWISETCRLWVVASLSQHRVDGCRLDVQKFVVYLGVASTRQVISAWQVLRYHSVSSFSILLPLRR